MYTTRDEINEWEWGVLLKVLATIAPTVINPVSIQFSSEKMAVPGGGEEEEEGRAAAAGREYTNNSDVFTRQFIITITTRIDRGSTILFHRLAYEKY